MVPEREAAICDVPRAVHIDDEIMRLLQTAGLAEAMRPLLRVSSGTKFVDSAGLIVLEWRRPQANGPQCWHEGYRFAPISPSGNRMCGNISNSRSGWAG